MIGWTKDDLDKIAGTDDLHISPFREDGKTFGTPTWIWSVVVDDDLYVRAYNGQSSRWYRAAMQQKAGRITAAGMTKEVTFELSTSLQCLLFERSLVWSECRIVGIPDIRVEGMTGPHAVLRDSRVVDLVGIEMIGMQHYLAHASQNRWIVNGAQQSKVALVAMDDRIGAPET